MRTTRDFVSPDDAADTHTPTPTPNRGVVVVVLPSRCRALYFRPHAPNTKYTRFARARAFLFGWLLRAAQAELTARTFGLRMGVEGVLV